MGDAGGMRGTQPHTLSPAGALGCWSRQPATLRLQPRCRRLPKPLQRARGALLARLQRRACNITHNQWIIM